MSPAVCGVTTAETYAASLIATDRTRTTEQAYLALLAARLNLAPGVVDHMDASVEADMPHA